MSGCLPQAAMANLPKHLPRRAPIQSRSRSALTFLPRGDRRSLRASCCTDHFVSIHLRYSTVGRPKTQFSLLKDSTGNRLPMPALKSVQIDFMPMLVCRVLNVRSWVIKRFRLFTRAWPLPAICQTPALWHSHFRLLMLCPSLNVTTEEHGQRLNNKDTRQFAQRAAGNVYVVGPDLFIFSQRTVVVPAA